MTSQEFVREKFPKAFVEHYNKRDPFDKKGYWICWSEHKGRHIAYGNSASNAWSNAKKELKEEIINSDAS